MHALHERVDNVLRQVAATIVMPRFRNLAHGEIDEKTPGEVVTIADRQAEEALTEVLLPLIPGARVVGEEACTTDPSHLHAIERGSVWIVDPIDGTSNFAAGQPPFGIMIALAHDGVTEAGWIFDPLNARMCHAVRGAGAFIDGHRLINSGKLPERPVAALATQFMTPEVRRRTLARATATFDVVPIPKCAAEHYPRLALCENHVAVFQRTLPWDHAAGALFLTEAGGRVTRWNGAPYAFGDDGFGIVAASCAEAWEMAVRLLQDEEDGDPDTRRLLPQQWDARLERA